MKNLGVFLNIEYHNEVLKDCDLIALGKPEQSSDLNTEHNTLFVMRNQILHHVPLHTSKVSQVYDLKDQFPYTDMPRPVAMWYRQMFDEVSVCYDTGDVYIISVGCLSQAECYRAHSFGTQIKLVQWSPDEELGLFMSDNTLFLTNSCFYNHTEIGIYEESAGEMELMSVGWGKKETQFHGSEGKQAAKAIPLSVDPTIVQDSRKVYLTWRGDATMFAISYWCHNKGMRRIKIYNSEGTLQCYSEHIPGMEGPVCWKPEGNLIAFSQRLPDKCLVSFMEKNGLKHGDFTLPQDIKKKVWWSSDVWNRLYLVLEEGVLQTLEWSWTLNTSSRSPTAQQAYVAVIDNDNILLSSFREAIIPPPMCGWQLRCPEAVNSLMFHPIDRCCSEGYMLAALLSRGSVALFRDLSSQPLLAEVDLAGDLPCLTPDKLAMAHWAWLSQHHFLLCYPVRGITHVIQLKLEHNRLIFKKKDSVEGEVVTCSGDEDLVLVQTSEGRLHTLSTYLESTAGEPTRPPHLPSHLPEPCHQVSLYEGSVLALSGWQRLYLDCLQVATNVTSYVIRDPFLLATTSSHSLIIYRHHNSKLEEISVRKLERGSQLVVTSGHSVVLQLPRGNLETIQPRALTILSVAALLEERCYSEALLLMRQQRINLNLCVDHDPHTFLDHLQTSFIGAVDPAWLTLLVTELSQSDVTSSLYQLYYTKGRSRRPLEGDKVKVVCKALEAAILGSGEKERYLVPLLSLLVRQGRMEDALRLATSTSGHSNQQQQLLQHLLFIMDIDSLYREALGTYNLEAAFTIASKSQKDPKEYIGYLNGLRGMEPDYMKYTIDKMLGRTRSALEHISRCGAERVEECYQLIRDHCLYAPALNIFTEDHHKYCEIAFMYAEYLFKQCSYEESGAMYVRSGHKEEAKRAFVLSGNWRQAMLLGKQLDYSETQMEELGVSLRRMLQSQKRHREATSLCMEWFGDVDTAVQACLEGSCWEEAIYLAERHNPQLLETVIKKAILEVSNFLIEDISGNRTKMENFTTRLLLVRQEKLNKPAYQINDDCCDMASDISSLSSVKSSKSFQSRSSKNTKKMNRKMWSLKEGNPREEEALVAALSQAMEAAGRTTDEVRWTCRALIHLREDRLAGQVQSEMEQFVQTIEQSTRKIWPKDPNLDGIAAMDDKYKYPPELSITPGWQFHILKN